MNNKYLILFAMVTLLFFGCKDKCPDDDPQLNCEGDMVQIDGECQCPENTARFALSTQCRPYSENDFWIQEGDECLGNAFLIFGQTGQDVFDASKTTIETTMQKGPSGNVGSTFLPITKLHNGYLIEDKFIILYQDNNYFLECKDGVNYDGLELHIMFDLDWTTAEVTYKFWNDIDPSSNIKKEFGKELKATFKNNTGPKER